jgi:hypothetical protein
MDRRNKNQVELPPVIVTRAEGWQNGQLVATMNTSNKATIYTNARLMAAAPDLLMVAQLLTLAPLQHGLDVPDELMRLALAAIAKAEGREP